MGHAFHPLGHISDYSFHTSILQSGIGFWQNRTIQLQNGSVETVVRDMAQRMESMEQTLKETAAKGAKLEKQIEDMVQERKLVENKVPAAIAQAVEQTVKRAMLSI